MARVQNHLVSNTKGLEGEVYRLFFTTCQHYVFVHIQIHRAAGAAKEEGEGKSCKKQSVRLEKTIPNEN